MDGLSLSWRSLPESLIDRHGLQDRAIARSDGADREFRFLYRDVRPVLPVWVANELTVLPWGQPPRRSKLPRTRIVAHETLKAGIWQQVHPQPVEIPANFGLDKGVWYRIREGVQGILVRDESGSPVVYLLTEPATHYYQIMTRNNRMPMLCGGERI